MKILLVFVVWDFIVRRINGVYVYHGDLVSNPDYSAREVLKYELLDRYERIKYKYMGKEQGPLCMNGSLFYNGSCIYFSKTNQKLPWLVAERFCRKLPFNASLLTIYNDNQLEAIRKHMVEIRFDENPLDQLVFSIGFYKRSSTWTWLSDANSTKLNLTFENEWPNENNFTHGACGVIALNRGHDIILRSSACIAAEARFICEYNLNPCFMGNVCGKYGKCINMHAYFYCDCNAVSYFHTGKYCDQLNSKAYQTIIGAILILIFIVIGILLNFKKKISRCFRFLCLKSKKHEEIYDDKSDSTTSEKDTNSEGLSREESHVKTLWAEFLSLFCVRRKIKQKTDSNDRQQMILYFIQASFIFGLTLTQIVFIHTNFFSPYIYGINNDENEIINSMCGLLEKYLFEELVYLVVAFFIFLVIIVTQKKRRFSNFIMKKYKGYFNKQIDEDADKISIDLSDLTKIKAGASHENIFNRLKNKILGKCKSKEFPSPTIPFSTTRRSHSAAVYIIYTYDVLNIFMSIYTDNINASFVSSFISNISTLSGILIDLLFQVIQVMLVGVKFYPILVVADSNPSVILYFVSMIYLFIIWIVGLLNKAFCTSQKEQIVKRTLFKLSSNLNKKVLDNLESKYNLTNKLLGTFSDEVNPAEKYLSDLKYKVPGLFNEYFGLKNNKPAQEIVESNNLSPKINPYYAPNYTAIPNQILSTSSPGLRYLIGNKTLIFEQENIENLTKKFDYYWDMSVSFLENLPLYLSLAYLVTNYTLLFISSLVERFSQQNSNITEEEKEIENILLKHTLEIPEEDTDIHNYQEDPLNLKTKVVYNHNYEYIKILFKNCKLFDTSSSQNNLREQKFNIMDRQRSFIKNKLSFFLNFFQKNIYYRVPHMKYSKQFINTYTVAFMVVYFFTLYGLKLSGSFGRLLSRIIQFLFKFFFSEIVKSFRFKEDNEETFSTEFKITIIFASLITIIQLLLSIRHFHNDLIRLNKGENSLGLITKLYPKLGKKKSKLMTTLVSDSLHFPGYLIAHLVYGYLILIIILFCIVVFFKFLLNFPRVQYYLIQILLPLVIVIFIKYFLIGWFLPRFVLLDEDKKRLDKIAAYYILSYFNFFFDCFLGLASCLSRSALTNLIGLITVTRIDVSTMNSKGNFLIKRLDKAYMAYISYVTMEHYYNNPILNGFCEIITDSMLNSQRNSDKVAAEARKLIVIEEKIDKKTGKFERSISCTYSKPAMVYLRSNSQRIPRNFMARNEMFEFESYLRLRNLLYLCLLLKKNPVLKSYRYKKLDFVNKSERRTEKFHEAIRRHFRKYFKMINMHKIDENEMSKTDTISRSYNLKNSRFFN